MDVSNVAVLGGGNVALATAAELSNIGLSVNLFELPGFEHSVQAIVEKGGIEYSGVSGEGFARLNMVITDIEKALKNVDLILLTAPVFAHELFVDACLPYFKDGQVFLTETAYFACLRFAKKVKQTGKRVIMAEMNQSPYTCVKKSPSHVFIDAKRSEAFIGAIPVSVNVMEKLGQLTSVYPGLAHARNVVQTSLDNMSWIAHPPIVSIADQVDVPVPAISALLKLYFIIDDVDYLNDGLNVKKMGIKGMSADEIVKIMDDGF